MSPTAEQLLQSALALPEEERVELVEALLAECDQSLARPFDEAWLAEARRRSAEIDAGAVELTLWPVVKRVKDLGIDRLSVEDRLALVEEIWDSVAREVEQAPLTEAQRRELESRLADSIARPDAVIPWEEVKARALARTRN